MALTDEMAAALNAQVTSEMTASLIYLQMSAHFEADHRYGMASWMRQQSQEEAGHARSFMDFVVARGGRVAIGTIPAPPSDLGDPVQVFAAALEYERTVTSEIRSLYEMATAAGDLECLPLLQGFLAEQVGEEAAVAGIGERLRRVGDSEVALMLIDKELGARQDSA